MFSRPDAVSEKQWLTWSTQMEDLLNLTEPKIQGIWRKPLEPELIIDEDFDNLKYHWDAPLYQKMIFRLRNCPREGRGFYFWNQIDPCNRSLLVRSFCMEDCKQVSDILNMLIWYYNTYNKANFYDDFNDPSKRKEILEKYSESLKRD